MSDFLTSLVSRNLGIQVERRAGDADVQPRPVAVFEPGGPGEAVPEPTPEETEAAPERLAQEPPPLVPAMPKPSDKPVPPPDVVEHRLGPPVPGGEAEERATAPSTDRDAVAEASALSRLIVHVPASGSPPPEPPQDRDAAPPVPERTDRMDRQELPTAPPTPAPGKRRAPQAPEPPVARRGRADPPLERIVRQMVLAPRPDPAPPRDNPNPLGRLDDPPVPSVPRELRANAPVRVIEPLRPVPMPGRPEPAPSPGTARLRTPAPGARASRLRPGAPEQSLAPVPEPIHAPEPAPAETVVQIRIGRIEVRTGAEIPPTAPPRTPPPEPVMMSLDDYLSRRSQER